MKSIVVLFALALTINTHAARYKCEVPDTKPISFEEVARIGCKTLEGKVLLTDEELAAELLVQIEDASRKLTEEVDRVKAAARKRDEIRQAALVQLAKRFPKDCGRASGTLTCVIVPRMPRDTVLTAYPT